MARPRFTGQGFTNPIDSLGFNAESRHRAMPPISNAFMSNEAFHRPAMPTLTPIVLETKGKNRRIFWQDCRWLKKFLGKIKEGAEQKQV